MAGIDKIYGTVRQQDQLHDWLTKNKPEYLKYLYPIDKNEPFIFWQENRAIANFPKEADMWLLENCALDFVIERIKYQYNISP